MVSRLETKSVTGYDFCLRLLVYFSRDVANQFESNSVWPRQAHELVPISGDNLGHVKPGQKCYGNLGLEPEKINVFLLSPPVSKKFITWKHRRKDIQTFLA